MASNIFSGMGFVETGMTPNSGSVVCHSVDTGITATGSNQATAAALVSNINIVGTVAASTGVSLPSVAAPGAVITVTNLGANPLTVYPPVGGIVNQGSVNAAYGSTIAALSGTTVASARFVQTAALTYVGI